MFKLIVVKNTDTDAFHLNPSFFKNGYNLKG